MSAHPVGEGGEEVRGSGGEGVLGALGELSTPSLSARGRRLRLATMAGMRVGRSVANWWRLRMTGGSATRKKRTMAKKTAPSRSRMARGAGWDGRGENGSS